MLSVIFVSVSLIAFALHLASSRQPRTKSRVVELLLLYLLAVNVGVGGILAWARTHVYGR